MLVDGSPQQVTPSIGASVFTRDGEDIDTLMRQADMAMYEVKSNGRNGWEALLRWQQQERGRVAPEVFIPIAEHTGLINQRGQLVLRKACREAASWQQRGFGQFGISVNLSTSDLLRHLKGRGVRAAIADFGHGYSSLSSLSRFPIDRLKNDRSCVASSLNDRSGALIVEAVISLARWLGMAAIAGGVETPGQLRFLRCYRRHQIQGYLMGRPMPAREIRD